MRFSTELENIKSTNIFILTLSGPFWNGHKGGELTELFYCLAESMSIHPSQVHAEPAKSAMPA